MKRLDEKMETKVCNQCERELPMNLDYYFKNCGTKDGFTGKCKECRGKKFTNKLTKIPKDGYKFCIKCDRELKATNSYFPPDISCKDGLRNVCRECGADGHFMDEDYIPKKWWTDEENKRFKGLYPHYTNKELIEIHYPDETEKRLSDKAYLLGVVKSDETINRINLMRTELWGIDSPIYGIKRSEETKRKLSLAKKGKFVGKDNWWYGKKRSMEQRLYIGKIKRESGNWKGEKNPRHINPLNGEENGRWQGGITALYAYLRRNLAEWKDISMKESNYKCAITGDNFDDIHHIYSFDTIVKDTLNNLNLPVKQSVSDYTNEEIKLIEQECLRIHMTHHGVCLRRDVHLLFHEHFGYGNNTPKQFEIFKLNYTNNRYEETEVLNIGI